jgi:hypothetical protein
MAELRRCEPTVRAERDILIVSVTTFCRSSPRPTEEFRLPRLSNRLCESVGKCTSRYQS